MNPTRRSFLHALGLAPLAAWLTSRVSAAPALAASTSRAIASGPDYRKLPPMRFGKPLYVGTDGSAVPEGHELRDPAHPHPVGTLVDFTTPNTAWVRLGPGEDVRRGDLLVRDGATVRKAKTCAHGKRTGEWCTGCVDWAHT